GGPMPAKSAGFWGVRAHSLNTRLPRWHRRAARCSSSIHRITSTTIQIFFALSARRPEKTEAGPRQRDRGVKIGDCMMARLEILYPDHAPLGNAAGVSDMLFELGMMYSVGRDVPIDLISAHKWFNL